MSGATTSAPGSAGKPSAGKPSAGKPSAGKPSAGVRPQARPVRPARARSTTVGDDNRMTALLLLALAIAITGLHNVLQEYGWWGPPFGVMVVVFVVAAVVRFYLRRRWAGTLAGLVAGILIVTLFFASGSSLLGFIPTGDTLDRFQALVTAGNDSIARQTLPAIATSGIEFLICIAVAAIAVFMDGAANWWRAPALVGVPLLLVVVIPSIIIADLADALTFLLTALVYLLIVLSRGRRPQPVLTASVAIAAILGALIAPGILPSVTPGGPSGTSLGVLSDNINPIINLGADLRKTDAVPILSYKSNAATGEYLQLTTLDTFRGQQWAPDTPPLKSSHKVKNIGTAPGLTAATDVSGVSTSIKVDNANSAWLPVPYPALSVTGLTGTWLWEDQSLAIRSTDASTAGQTYSVSSLDVEPTTQELESAGSSASNPLAKVPTGLDPIVAATAKKVVGNAKTDFDKAVALQNWFRGGTFTYSTTAPAHDGYDGSGLDIIAPFLKTKAGYCVHFATTMAMMARTLGIPSRVAVGFLPGSITHPVKDPNVYQVTSSDMHAWPELYFKGVGWVRFEPTPSKGFEPAFPTAPGVTSSTGPTGAPTSASTGAATTAPVKHTAKPGLANPTGPGASGSGGSSSSSSLGWGGLGVLAVVLLVAIPGLIRIGIRRRRFDLIRRGIDSAGWAWQELRESAHDLGIAASEALTPKQLAALLGSRFTGQQHQRPRAALVQLVKLVENEAYGRATVPDQVGFGSEKASAGEEMADLLQTVLRGLRWESPLAARLTAVITPPSLLDRIRGRRVIPAT